MTTVPEYEMQQKMSEFIIHVIEYYANKKGDFRVVDKRNNAVLTCINGEVNLDLCIKL